MQKLTLKEILLKYEAGNCSEEEVAVVETFYLEIPVNDDAALSDDELVSAVERVAERLPIKSIPIKKVTTLWPKAAAAAMLLISLSIGGYMVYRAQPKSGLIARKKTEDIKPGDNEAVLTLANGQKIILRNAKNGQLTFQAGSRISKNAAGQVVYSPGIVNRLHESVLTSYNTLSTPLGGQYQIILPDGSHIWLNALSSVRYPTKFIGRERIVELEGEAYFEVAHDKLHPFIVKSKGQVVEVLGTHFNVMAYSNDATIKTTLLQGSVKIGHNEKSEILKPGEQMRITGDKVSVIDHIDTEDVVSWKNGYFKFHEPLKDIMQKISRWYNVEVIYAPETNQTQVFTGHMSRSRNLSDLLKLMEYTDNVHFKVEGRRITVEP